MHCLNCNYWTLTCVCVCVWCAQLIHGMRMVAQYGTTLGLQANSTLGKIEFNFPRCVLCISNKSEVYSMMQVY